MAATYEVTFKLVLKDHLTGVAKSLGEVNGGGYPVDCEIWRTVRIQRKKGGAWVRVASGETGPTYNQKSAQFKAELPDKPGRYRVVAARKTKGNTVCKKTTSKVVKHTH